MNSCRVVVAVRLAEVHVATPFWYIINLKLDVHAATFTKAFTINVLLATCAPLTTVLI